MKRKLLCHLHQLLTVILAALDDYLYTDLENMHPDIAEYLEEPESVLSVRLNTFLKKLT